MTLVKPLKTFVLSLKAALFVYLNLNNLPSPDHGVPGPAGDDDGVRVPPRPQPGQAPAHGRRLPRHGARPRPRQLRPPRLAAAGRVAAPPAQQGRGLQSEVGSCFSIPAYSLELETKAIRRFAKVSIVSYSRPSLMIIASATQFHVHLPWGQRPFSIVS